MTATGRRSLICLLSLSAISKIYSNLHFTTLIYIKFTFHPGRNLHLHFYCAIRTRMRWGTITDVIWKIVIFMQILLFMSFAVSSGHPGNWGYKTELCFLYNSAFMVECLLLEKQQQEWREGQYSAILLCFSTFFQKSLIIWWKCEKKSFVPISSLLLERL